MTPLRDRPMPWMVLLAAIFALAVARPASGAPAESAADSAGGAPDSARPLAPTSEPPWTPPAPVPPERRWEEVARVPGEIVSFPLSVLGLGMKGAIVYAEETDLLPRAVARLSLLALHGLLIGPASLGDHTGWGAEVGISPPFFRYLTAAVSGSTSGYNRTDLMLEAPQGRVAYRYDWRPSDPFFGVGPTSRLEDESNFASKSQSVRVELRYPFRRPSSIPTVIDLMPLEPAAKTPAPPYSFRVWAGPRDVVVLDGRERTAEDPPVSDRFPAVAAQQLGVHVEHFVYGLAASYDTRSGRPHWSRGWRLSSSIERFDEPLRSFALHRANTPSVTFARWTHEGEAGVSFWRDPRTLRLYARIEDLAGVGGEGVFPLIDLTTLGGRVGLSGFEPGRFRDADLVLGRLSYIFPLARFLEGDLHAEAGNVMAGLGDTRFGDFKTSYGAALRVRSPFAPLGSFGLDWSREIVRLRFALGGVE